jgi:hypothetical protein
LKCGRTGKSSPSCQQCCATIKATKATILAQSLQGAVA